MEFLQILQNSQENTCAKDSLYRLAFNEVADLQFYFIKKEIPVQMFFVNSAKFLITLFLKNHSHGCFCINTRSVYCFITIFCVFQKRCHIYFPAKYFLSLMYRLGTKVNSIFQTVRGESHIDF